MASCRSRGDGGERGRSLRDERWKGDSNGKGRSNGKSKGKGKNKSRSRSLRDDNQKSNGKSKNNGNGKSNGKSKNNGKNNGRSRSEGRSRSRCKGEILGALRYAMRKAAWLLSRWEHFRPVLIREMLQVGDGYLGWALSLFRTCLRASSFWPASPSLPAAVRRW